MRERGRVEDNSSMLACGTRQMEVSFAKVENHKRARFSVARVTTDIK